MTTSARDCGQTHLGCGCRGDDRVHEREAHQRSEARAQADALVACPECDRPTPPLQLVTWGNCRACRTAQSRSVQPLRW